MFGCLLNNSLVQLVFSATKHQMMICVGLTGEKASTCMVCDATVAKHHTTMFILHFDGQHANSFISNQLFVTTYFKECMHVLY